MASAFPPALLLCSVLLAICQTSWAAAGPKTVHDIISTKSYFSIAKAAADAANLHSITKDEGFFGTIFLPTDSAFKDFFRKTGLTPNAFFSSESFLAKIMLFHATSSRIPAKSIERAPSSTSFTAFSNMLEQLSVSKSSKAVITISSALADAKVTKQDMKTKKGAIVHAIDTVLIPQSLFVRDTYVPEPNPDFPGCKSVYEILVGLKLNSFIDVLKKAQLDSLFTPNNAPLTVLVPTNKAIKSLLTNLNTTLDDAETDQMWSLVYYHLISQGPAPAKRLANGLQIPTMYSVRGTRQTITSFVDKKGLFFKAAKSTARVVKADYFACKAVVHLIDTVLLPSS